MTGIKKILTFRLLDILPFRNQPTKIAMKNYSFIGFAIFVLIGLFYLITSKEKGIEVFLVYLVGGILLFPALFLAGLIVDKLQQSSIKLKWLYIGLCCGIGGFVITFFIGLIVVAILSYNSGLIIQNGIELVYASLGTFCLLFIFGILISFLMPNK